MIIYLEDNDDIYFIFVKLKTTILLLFDLIFLFIIIIITIEFKTKICICTLGKEENKYTREFVEYYKKIGVDKIILN